nr:MAG TPA: hypothetical protein [Caudoviricetes sp.]
MPPCSPPKAFSSLIHFRTTLRIIFLDDIL